ncbi:MAG: DUF6624 domain-containing protein [Planctomycetota bacterium]
MAKLPVPSEREREALRVELLDMQERDQRMERIVIDGDPAREEPGFYDRKQAQQDRQGERCREIFDRWGYPGSDMVGDEASDAFWLIVQHADSDPQFQGQVAAAMKDAVARGHARGEELAYLTDRVRINTGRKQLYGTQIQFDGDTGRVLPKALEDAARVDERREEIGLEPLWEYINGSTEMHFRMNEAGLRERGIAAPPLLPAGYQSW